MNGGAARLLLRSPNLRMQAALLLLPLFAVVVVFHAILFDGWGTARGRQETQEGQVRLLAAVLSSRLVEHGRSLQRAATTSGAAPGALCATLDVLAGGPGRTSVYETVGETLCGPDPDRDREAGGDWYAWEGDVRSGGPGAVRYRVRVPLSAILALTAGRDVPFRVALSDSDGRTFDRSTPADEIEPGRRFSVPVAHTSWLLTAWLPEPGGRRTPGPVLPAVAAALLLVPFAVGHRGPAKDMLRIGEFAGIGAGWFDERLDTGAFSFGATDRTRVANLLDLIDAADHSPVLAALHGPLPVTVRFRTAGTYFPAELRLLGRTRRPGGRRRYYVTIARPWSDAGPGDADADGGLSGGGPVSRVNDRHEIVSLHAAHETLLRATVGSHLPELFAERDRWKLLSALRDTHTDPARWQHVTATRPCGRSLRISVRSTRADGAGPAGADGHLLRLVDVTDERCTAAFAGFVDAVLDRTDGRSLDTLLDRLAAELAPGFRAGRVVGRGGGIRLEFDHDDSVTLDATVRRTLHSAEQLARLTARGDSPTRRCTAPEAGGHGTCLARRRELAVTLQQRVLQPLLALHTGQGGGSGESGGLAGVLPVLRELVSDLRVPPWQEHLVDAVRRTATLLEAGGVTVTVQADLSEPLDAAQQQLVLRSVGECFANVMKHARASHVQTLITNVAGALVVRVTDDGAGGRPGGGTAGTRLNGSGTGLVTLHEDAAAHGGTFTIRFPAGGGCVAEMRVPAAVGRTR